MVTKKAVEVSLAYGRNYGVLLDRSRLSERLITNKIISDKDIDKLIKKENIKLGVYSHKQKEIFDNKMKLAKKLSDRLSNFRTILFMGVSGSVASEYPKLNDDIDILIICKKNSMWITRAGVMAYIKLAGIPHRKIGRREKKNEFCFNLWLDENELELPQIKQDLKNAMDAILVKKLINRERTWERFLGKNDWIRKYLAKSYENIDRFVLSKEKDSNLILKALNRVFFWGQYWYMKKRITKEVVDINKAFFHPTLQI